MKVLYINSPKYDLLTALHIEGLLCDNDIDIMFTSLGNYVPSHKVLYHWEAIDYLKSADLVILGSRPWIDTSLLKYIPNSTTVVSMEGGDESSLTTPLGSLLKLKYIFKREVYINDLNPINLLKTLIPHNYGLWSKITVSSLFPYPFIHGLRSRFHFTNFLKNIIVKVMGIHVIPYGLGIEKRMIGLYNPNPEWTISCMLRPHIDERIQLLEILKEMNIPKLWTNLIFPSNHDKEVMYTKGACHPALRGYDSIGIAHNENYYHQINNSRACISIPGGGFDTLRFWEILAQGSLLISKRISIVIPNAPIEGLHYLAFDTLE